MNIADDISKAYHEGYKQGRFDAIADIPHGVEKGYSVVAVVRCGECKYNTSEKKCLYPDSIIKIPDDNDFCSYGERKESEGST